MTHVHDIRVSKTVKQPVKQSLFRPKTLFTHHFTIDDREGISHLVNPFFVATGPRAARWRRYKEA